MMKKINRFFYIAAAALMMAAACNPDNPENTPQPAPSTGGSDPVMTELTESSINGTSIGSNITVAGVVKDKSTGQGISGVNVTDGFTWSTTDANGVYQLTFNKLARKVYYTTPSDYKIYQNADGYPFFYCKDNLEFGKKYRVDFTLEKLSAPETDFTLIAIGDPQCATTSDVARYASETIPKIRKDAANHKNVYAVTLGDIIFDSNNTWYPMYASMKNVITGGVTIPFFQCMGNHDHDATIINSSMDHATMQYTAQTNFVKYFGPQDYSFDRGNAHIVVMDDVWVTGFDSSSKSNGKTCTYAAGFSSEQLAWLTQDIANVKDAANKLVIICCHIPFRAGANSGGSSVNKTKNYAAVLSLLSTFKEAHIMIGHTHYNQNYIHSVKTKSGQPIYEHVHGAACGAWWASNSNVTGGPNGYGLYEISGSTIVNWQAKNSNFDDSFQMRIWDGNQEFTGSKGYKLKWSSTSNTVNGLTAKGFAAADGAFVAEVFNDDASNWKLEFWQNGTKVGDFTRAAASGICNIPIVSFWFNEKNKSTSTWTSSTASHFWYYKPASGTPSAEKNWEVRATHTIAASGEKNVYTANKLTTDYSTF